jgi:hypothetical protein
MSRQHPGGTGFCVAVTNHRKEMTMTKKRRRVNYAKAIRRATGMKLPESMKVAKFYIRWLECEFPEPPSSVMSRVENTCGIPGCCYTDVYYVMSREGKPITIASVLTVKALGEHA